MKHSEVARQWWAQSEGTFDSGVAVVYQGEVVGWIDKLRDPHHWQPGSIAVDKQGRQWQASGGDANNGAALWLPLGDHAQQEGVPIADSREFGQIGQTLLSLGVEEAASCMGRALTATAIKAGHELEFNSELGTVTVSPARTESTD